MEHYTTAAWGRAEDIDDREVASGTPGPVFGHAGWKRTSRTSEAAMPSKSSTKEIMDQSKQDRRAQRRKAYLNKFSGQKKKSETTLTDVQEAAPLRRGRDIAPVVLYKSTQKKMTNKPQVKPTWQSYGGRSFLSSDWKHDEDIIDTSQEDSFEDFFTFTTSFDRMDEVDDIGIIKCVKIGDFVDGTLSIPCEYGIGGKTLPARKDHWTNDLKNRRTKKKAWQVFGTFIGRKLKRKAKEHLQRRPIFTTWLSFVQIVIMAVVLCVYPFAPIGIDVREHRADITLSREGVLQKENLRTNIIESFWLGPSLETLILLGAKYAPCMRRDTRVFAQILKDRKAENGTGCCAALLNNGCIQRESKSCMTPSVEFLDGKVCGQDPQFCLLADPPPSKWKPFSITTWPRCLKHKPAPQADAFRHLTCRVTGRPCCVKTQGQCVITTRENCAFQRGVFHPGHTLCSQVDCLAATCGGFTNHDQPDHFHRMLLSLFMCAGVAHLVVVLLFNATILKDIEGYAGCVRTAVIFIATGVGGNLWSSVLLPYQAEVGESGAMFGIFACVFVEGVRKWDELEAPRVYMGRLCLILVVALLFGLLPMVDNFAHIFGFMYGILLGFPLLPTAPSRAFAAGDVEAYKRERRVSLCVNILCLLCAVVVTLLGVVLFYYRQDTQSSMVALFNCPFGDEFCRNFHQGQELEPRLVQY